MTIDFEKDQQDAMKKTGNIQSLADQVESLENVVSTIEAAEENIKLLKKKEINKGKSTSSGIRVRNWWRPTCYNANVGGAKSSDHIQARGFDLDFKTPKERAVAQAYLCKMYREGKPLSLQVGIGCQTLHVGIGSPKRLSRYPSDGSRFWKYGSLNNCSIKRIKADDCWKQGHDGKLYIYTDSGGGGVL